MPDSPSAASTAAAAATASGKHCPPPNHARFGGFFGSSRKVWGSKQRLRRSTKSCTRKAHESATNSIARRGQGGTSSLFICPLQGQGGTSSLFVCPLQGLGQRTNCSSSDQSQGSRQQRRRQRSVPASNSAPPQERLQVARPPRFREKTFFLPASCRFPAKSLNPSEFFSETLLTNCLSFGILIKLNRFSRANMAQSVEQRFRKPQVEGSSPSVGSLFEV